MSYDPYDKVGKDFQVQNTHRLSQQFGSAVPYQTENRAMREHRSEAVANMLLAETIQKRR